jgi:SynChlorMet cassette protein ScmC
MRLSSAPSGHGRRNAGRIVRVWTEAPRDAPSGITCILPQPESPKEIPFAFYTAISSALARGFLEDGGILLHGALAEYRPTEGSGKGVIFSAAGGTGKTTASRRLPAPWHSLSDDAVLVAPGGNGEYRAHPWPTWSSFLFGDRVGGAWDTQTSVPLRACVFMRQASRDSLEPLGAGQTVSLLTESARQINFLDSALEPDLRRKIRLLRFDAVCKLAKAVPAHLLHISLTGEFWRAIERAL